MRFFVILSAALLCACSTQQYRYVASESSAEAPAHADGRVEVTFSVPPDAPQGKAQVSSMGVVEVEPAKGAKRVPALHLRLTASNHSGKGSWQLDSQEQRVAFPGAGSVPPTFVNSDSALPRIEIAPGELRLLDLYFSLPEGTRTAGDLPNFTFRWQLVIDGKPLTQSILFKRRAVPEGPVVVSPYEPYPYAPGWGAVWWGSGIWGPRGAPVLRYQAR